MTAQPYNVLFLCTGNSCRSIMAEAIIDAIGDGHFKGYSAGVAPKGQVHAVALDLLAKLGHPVGQLRSKNWDEVRRPGAPEFDFVFTVCDEAANEPCPVWPGSPITSHWGVPDPATFVGSVAETYAVFEDVYRMIERRISIFVNLPLRQLDAVSLRHRLDTIGRD